MRTPFVQTRIHDLVEYEHDLRARLADGSLTVDAERELLSSIETELDQCWDLLRQRQAAQAAGLDPDQVHVRSAKVVENYIG